MTTPMAASAFRMNDLVPCPSRSARMRHRARAERCETCDTEGRTVEMEPLAVVLERYRDARTEAA